MSSVLDEPSEETEENEETVEQPDETQKTPQDADRKNNKQVLSDKRVFLATLINRLS